MVGHIELPSKPMKSEYLQVAKLGRTVGLKGDLKIHFLSDFPEQFKKGSIFHTHKHGDLEVVDFDKKRSLIRFLGFDNPQISQTLVNTILLSTKEQTKQNCKLEKDEFFWFDIIGLDVFEDSKKLGTVKEIERIVNTDYLSVKSDGLLVEKGLAKTFLIPYIDRYIVKTCLDEKRVYVKDGFSILESS